MSSMAPKFAAAVVVAAVALIVTGNAYAGGKNGGGNTGSSGTHVPISSGTKSFLPPKNPPARGHPCVPAPASHVKP